jgi:hypothetical protein
MTTRQNVELGTKEGKQFLRRVVKQQLDSNMDNGWRIFASEATDWKLVFRRTVRAKKVGEFNQEIEVMTDSLVRLPGRTGQMVQSFHDSEPVCMLTPTYVSFNGESGLVAKLLADGFTFEIEASPGSTSSSRHGISTYRALAVNRAISYCGVQVGHETLAMNGHVLISSSVSVK